MKPEMSGHNKGQEKKRRAADMRSDDRRAESIDMSGHEETPDSPCFMGEDEAEIRFLLRIHFGQISSDHMLLGVMEDLKNCTISRVSEVRDVMGVNMAALHFLKREIEAKEEILFFADATERFQEKRRKRKKKDKLMLTVA
ncbi:WD repeat-containing protein 3 [Mantella aurantiaca]